MNVLFSYISLNQQFKRFSTTRSIYAIALISILLICLNYPNGVALPPNYNLKIKIVDSSPYYRPIDNATILILNFGTFVTNSTGYSETLIVPAGIYDIIVTWKSDYNPQPVTIAETTIILDKDRNVTIPASVYDVTIKLVTPGGKPIVNANVSLADVWLNVTSAEGKVNADLVPSMYIETNPSYPVKAIWLGMNISLYPIMITSTKTYVLTAKNIANLTVKVVGTQGQGINAAKVEIKNGAGMIIFNGTSNEQGITHIEVPWGHYNITIKYQNSIYNTSVTVSSPTGTKIITTDIFIIIFGQAMTFATFIILIVLIVLSIAIILIIGNFLIKRREKKKKGVKLCPMCGEKLGLDVNFCTKCGTRQLTRLEESEES